ncbi:MAG: CopG family transcriptional regulator [Candidatus Bathyarchaeia archaeon]
MTKFVTVSAKIDVELRKKLTELGIKPSEVIRRALEKEVEDRMKQRLYEKIKDASEIIRKVDREVWIKAIRETREER